MLAGRGSAVGLLNGAEGVGMTGARRLGSESGAVSQEINAELAALQAGDLSDRSRLEIQARVVRIAGTCLADAGRGLKRLELHTEHGSETYADLIEALCSGGPELVDLLLGELRRVRGLCEERMTVHSRWALQSFGFMEQNKAMSQHPDVVAALIEGLTSRHALVRLEAVDSLGGLSLESMPSVVAAIKNALGDPDWRVRYVAEQILGDAGMLPPEHRVSLLDRIRRVVRPERSWASARWSIGWVLLAYLLVGCHGPAESSDVAAEASLDPQLRSAMGSIGERAVTQDGVAGLAIAVAMDQEVVFAEGFGSADASGELPIDAETRFDLGSIGKVFTSAAVMQLVEQGELSLDDRVQDHLSWIPPHYPEATLEQLLRHTSGFVSQEVDEFDPPADYFEPRFGAALLTDSELVNGVARFPAGENHVYSNPGFLFLGEVIEAASGVRYDRYVAQRVIDPAGPNQMLVCQAPPGEKATAHFRREDEQLRQAPPLHMSAWGGSGGVRSGVSDLIRWMIRLEAGEIASEESLARMRTPTTLRGAQATADVPYGLGMRLGAFRGAARYGHTGTYPSGTAALYSYPEASLQIAVLSNTNGPEVPHAHRYEAEIAALLLGLESEPLTPVALTSVEKRMVAGAYEDFRSITASFDATTTVKLKI